ASTTLAIVMLVAGIAGGMAIAWFFAALLTRSLHRAVGVANAVAEGNLENDIVVDSQDEIGELLLAMQRMQHDLRERIEHDQRVAGENLRIRTALDSSGTAVMIADASHAIIYANQAMGELLEQYAADVRRALPDV